jgi:integrase
MTVIKMYLRYYPNKPIENGSPFLVFSDGSPLEKINVITRILNKIFGKNVGVSMLRHSYLTDKYKEVNAEKAKDAEAMSHSINQQTDYVLE